MYLPVRRLTRIAGGSGRVMPGENGLGNEVIGNEFEILRRFQSTGEREQRIRSDPAVPILRYFGRPPIDRRAAPDARVADRRDQRLSEGRAVPSHAGAAALRRCRALDPG